MPAEEELLLEPEPEFALDPEELLDPESELDLAALDDELLPDFLSAARESVR